MLLAVVDQSFQEFSRTPKKNGTPLTRTKQSLKKFQIPFLHMEIRDEQDTGRSPPGKRTDIRNLVTRSGTPEEIGRDKKSKWPGNNYKNLPTIFALKDPQ